MRRTIHKKTGSSYGNNTSCDSRDKDSQEDYGSNSDANISDLGSSKNAGSSATPQSMHTPLEFSEEQVAIFTRRYDEGYDVFVDKHYVAWLEIYHPRAIPPEKSPCQLSVMYLLLSQLGKGLSLLLLVSIFSLKDHTHLHPVLHPLQLEVLLLCLSLLLSV